MSGALRCATCGTDELRAESRFCRACGAPFADTTLPIDAAGGGPTVVDAPRGVPKTVPDQAPPRRAAPTRVDPAPMSAPVPYRLSPAPPMRSPQSAFVARPIADAPTAELTLLGLVVRALVAAGLAVGALFAMNALYERVKGEGAAWIASTLSQDRATSRAILGGAMAIVATLVVSLAVFVFSTRRRARP